MVVQRETLRVTDGPPTRQLSYGFRLTEGVKEAGRSLVASLAGKGRHNR